MSERSDLLLLQDILEAIKNIQSFTKNISFDQYVADLKTRHAVERNFSIIGEAVARLENSLKEQYQHINWRQVKDFRNIIIHDYFGIDDTIVWDIIRFDLNQLQTDIQELIKRVKEENK
jgi:uncharacterized protein with HEPN domain